VYDWKDIALLYKDEISNMRTDMYDALTHVDSKCPNGLVKASNVIEMGVRNSDKNVNFIENFEISADKAVKIVEKREVFVEKREVFGKRFSDKNWLEKGDFEKVEELCSGIVDDELRLNSIIEKCALLCVLKYLKVKNKKYKSTNLVKNKDNTLILIDKKTNVESSAKVLVSNMKFVGKTNVFGKESSYPVIFQHTYLVDPKESVKNWYFFTNFSLKEESITIYACVKGKYLNKMMVNPLRSRFVGRKACILQDQGYNNADEYPFSINELLLRSK
jgi:hypothetical protein